MLPLRCPGKADGQIPLARLVHVQTPRGVHKTTLCGVILCSARPRPFTRDSGRRRSVAQLHVPSLGFSFLGLRVFVHFFLCTKIESPTFFRVVFHRRSDGVSIFSHRLACFFCFFRDRLFLGNIPPRVFVHWGSRYPRTPSAGLRLGAGDVRAVVFSWVSQSSMAKKHGFGLFFYWVGFVHYRDPIFVHAQGSFFLFFILYVADG